MKKFLSLILALAMVACMSVTAFAADGTTVLTVEVPDNTPSYYLHCPATVTLTYGKTDYQEVGDVYLSDVVSSEDLFVLCKYTNLISTNDNTDTIPLALYHTFETSISRNLFDQTTGEDTDYGHGAWGGIVYRPQTDIDDVWKYPVQYLEAKVADWSGATPGATYNATITYVVTNEGYPNGDPN